MRKVALLLSLLAVLSAAAQAREVSGVQSPESVTVGDKTLKLNGMGLRKKAIFKVYVASLYLEATSKDAKVILATDQVRRVEMVMLRDLEKHKIVDAIHDGFEKNSAAALPKLQERLTRFSAVIPDLKEGDRLSITYVPGKGTSVGTRAEAEALTIEGKDFADALFAVWLGEEPVSEGLKEGMLGGE
jgi:hypothetical protein